MQREGPAASECVRQYMHVCIVSAPLCCVSSRNWPVEPQFWLMKELPHADRVKQSPGLELSAGESVKIDHLFTKS